MSDNKKFTRDSLKHIRTSFRVALYHKQQMEEENQGYSHLVPIPGLPPTDDIVKWYHELDSNHELRYNEPKLENYITYITNEEVDEEAKNRFNNDLLSHIKIMFRTGLYMEQLKEEGHDETPPPRLPSTDYILNWYYDLDPNHELRRDEPKFKDYLTNKEKKEIKSINEKRWYRNAVTMVGFLTNLYLAKRLIYNCQSYSDV